MKILATTMFIAVAMMTTAGAQNGTPQAKTTLEFDQQQMQWLGSAINELPKKIADPFLADLSRQMQDQQKKAAEAKAKADAEKKPDLKK